MKMDQATLVRPRPAQVKRRQHLNGDDIDYLLELNRQHSRRFTSAEAYSERQLSRVQHPTEIGTSKCMDGRIHLPLITETPLGIIQPWRNIGGKFDLSWPFYQETVQGWHEYALSRGRRCLQLVTYHFSRGEPHRGCRGFGYDRAAAQVFTANLKDQFDHDFGRTTLHAIQVGVETDLEALILHGDAGEVVDLSDLADDSSEGIRQLLERLYPDMHPQIVQDFMPLVQGNIRHIAKVRADTTRDLAVHADHQEWVLGVGRGFDWLHEINTALIVGPFAPDYGKVIEQAAGLIYDNLENGRTNGHKIVLLNLAAYRKQGAERNLRIRKARALEATALEAISKAHPKLLPHLQVLTGVVDMGTRLISVLERHTAV